MMYGLDSSMSLELATLRQQELLDEAARSRGRIRLSPRQRLSDLIDTLRFVLSIRLIRWGERLHAAPVDVECVPAAK